MRQAARPLQQWGNRVQEGAFAAPPFGANRLRPPEPVEPWEDVRDAFEFGPKSPQVAYPPGIADALAELVGPGADCLTLNVWTPGIGAGGRPVMVWIPGGMFEFHATGASALYDGGRFARDGVVCVTINYRVGAESFLYFGDGVANPGLLDQIAALKWVQGNIAAFGGDPGQVTIFGESAGGMSVATLLTMPLARGLFRRAIVESGNTPNVTSAATAERAEGSLSFKTPPAASPNGSAAASSEMGSGDCGGSWSNNRLRVTGAHAGSASLMATVRQDIRTSPAIGLE